MHWSLASFNRLRICMNRYGASSLSHSTSTGKPRMSLPATSASSCEYPASTACSGLSDAGRSFSVMAMDIGFASSVGLRGTGIPACVRRHHRQECLCHLAWVSHFQFDREGAALGVLGYFLHRAHLLGLLFERVARDLIYNLRHLRLKFVQLLLQFLCCLVL